MARNFLKKKESIVLVSKVAGCEQRATFEVSDGSDYVTIVHVERQLRTTQENAHA